MASYLGMDAKTMLEYAQKFRGDMFEKDKNGKWHLKNPIWEQEPIQGKYSIKDIMQRLGI